MKTLYICEKASLAEAVAGFLGKPVKKDGYFLAGDNCIVWLQGHILMQKMPEDYNPELKKYRYDNLPIIPEKWEKLVKPQGNYQRIYKTVLKLLAEAGEVVNVGDPDREGQLLVDEVLEQAGNTLPVKRLYINAMDSTSIKRAFENIADNSASYTTYLAALGRERTDWLFGINASRKYTLDAGSTIKAGRVKIPILALVARRNEEIDNFKSVKYYNVRALFRQENSLPFETLWQIPVAAEDLDSEGRLLDIIPARACQQKITGKSGIVKSVATEKGSLAPPLLFSLSTLQRVAEPLYGFSPSKTLELAQVLYEKKLTTYPRSDCNYLPESQFSDASVILANLKLTGNEELKKYADGADCKLKSKAYNSQKVSAHHALVPTMEKIDLNRLPADEQKLYFLIARRFISQFYPKQEFEQTAAVIECEGNTFNAHGKVILNNGWKVVEGAETAKEDDADNKQLPALHEGEVVTLTTASILEKNTVPPARYTQGTLIAALTNAHKYVKNPELRETVRNIKGIGTEATRSTIIKQLLEAGMLIEKKPKKKVELYVSESVKELIKCLPDEVTYPDMTALMELELDKIDAGQLSLNDYMRGQEMYIKKIISLESRFTKKFGKGDYTVCPVCGQGRLFQHESKYGKFWSCGNYKNGCKAIFSDVKGKPLIMLCPECRQGYLVKRKGRNGDFFGCNTYPCCNAAFASGKDGMPVLKKERGKSHE